MDELEDWSWIGGYMLFDVVYPLFLCYFYYFFLNYPISPSEVKYTVPPSEMAYTVAPSEVKWGYYL